MTPPLPPPRCLPADRAAHPRFATLALRRSAPRSPVAPTIHQQEMSRISKCRASGHFCAACRQSLPVQGPFCAALPRISCIQPIKSWYQRQSSFIQDMEKTRRCVPGMPLQAFDLDNRGGARLAQGSLSHLVIAQTVQSLMPPACVLQGPQSRVCRLQNPSMII